MDGPKPLKGLRVSLAGKFSVHWSQIKEAIALAGGEHTDFVSSATGILVVGKGSLEDNQLSWSHKAKITYAKQHHVKIMEEDEFAELLRPVFEYDPAQSAKEAQATLVENTNYGDW